jgi:hypothetical protein
VVKCVGPDSERSGVGGLKSDVGISVICDFVHGAMAIENDNCACCKTICYYGIISAIIAIHLQVGLLEIMHHRNSCMLLLDV